MATEENDSKISEPSSIKPLQAVNLMSDLELSDAPLERVGNVKLVLSGQESEVALDNVIKTASPAISSAEEVQTLDEISEEIEEDISQGSEKNTNSNTKGKSHGPKDSKKSERNETDHTSKNSSHNKRHSKSRSDSRHSRSSSKSKYSSQYTSEHSSLSDTSRRQKKTHSRHSKAESSRHSKHRTDISSKKSDDSYTSDFSESSKKTKTESSKKPRLDTRSAVSSTKVTSLSEMGKKTSKVIIGMPFSIAVVLPARTVLTFAVGV